MSVVAVSAARRGGGRLSVVGGAPPHDLGAEESLLGAMLLNREAAIAGMELVGPGDFYSPQHGQIFEAIEHLVVADKVVDAVTVNDELQRLKYEVESAYLVHLQVQPETSSSAGARAYGEIVQRLARARSRMHALRELHEATRAGDEQAEARWLAELEGDHPKRSQLEADDIGGLMRSPGGEIKPELLRCAGGKALLYAANVTLLHGEPSAGKSWVAVEAVRQVMAEGRTVVFLDYEGSPRTMATRLREIGVRPEEVDERLRYFRPGGLPMHSVLRVVRSLEPALVIVDSNTRALYQLGLDEDKAKEALKLLVELCRPLADAGAAVVVVDHVTKAKEGRGRWGRGSGAKLGEVDAGFNLEVIHPFSKGRPGSSLLRVAKDRHGAVGPEGEPVASASFGENLAGRLTVALRAVTEDDVEAYGGPTQCMAAIVELLEEFGTEISTAQMARVLSFRKSTIVDAAEQLTADPTSPVVCRKGARGAKLYAISPLFVAAEAPS